jgi:hypothetical protein
MKEYQKYFVAMMLAILMIVAGCATEPRFIQTGAIQLNQGWVARGTHQDYTNPFGKEYAQPGVILDPPGPALAVKTESGGQMVAQQPAVPPQMPQELEKAKLRTPAPAPAPVQVAAPPQRTEIQTPQEPKFYYGAPGGNGIGFQAIETIGNVGASFVSGGVYGLVRRPDNFNMQNNSGSSSESYAKTGPVSSNSEINGSGNSTNTISNTNQQQQNQKQNQQQQQKQNQKQNQEQTQKLKSGGGSHGGSHCN